MGEERNCLSVWQVSYQADQPDQFHHRYAYDADNRIDRVETSRNGVMWREEARYFYYAHGPLARTELGDKSVQGTDHYYTLQGWLRGVNSPTMDPERDPGQDAVASGLDAFFAIDANSYALGYYPGDLTPVGGSTTMLPDGGSGTYATAMADNALYNGNIPTMLTALRDLDGDPMPLHANVYSYDRLNRIKGMEVYHGAPAADLSALDNNEDYHTAYSYDPNGNLLTLQRNAHGNSAAPREMDELTYTYANGLNRLEFVDDAVGNSDWAADLDAQDPTNYAYDELGRLVQDEQASIGADGIHWTLMNKVRSITRETNATGMDLHFRYGPAGHRTVKEVRHRDGSGTPLNEADWETTYYIYDATGNPMAMYRRSYEPLQGSAYSEHLAVEGLPVYGSARLGMWDGKAVQTYEFTHSGFVALHFGERNYASMPNPWVDDESTQRTLGHKRYELANHLGNVLTTVSDRKVAVPDGGTQTLLDHYGAEIASVSDYYPFGSLLPGRNYSSDAYRFGFQGQEKDDELHGATGTSYAYEYRMHDPRVGRFLSIDPLHKKYPYLTPYQFSSNQPIHARELEGLESANELGEQQVFFEMSMEFLSIFDPILQYWDKHFSSEKQTTVSTPLTPPVPGFSASLDATTTTTTTSNWGKILDNPAGYIDPLTGNTKNTLNVSTANDISFVMKAEAPTTRTPYGDVDASVTHSTNLLTGESTVTATTTFGRYGFSTYLEGEMQYSKDTPANYVVRTGVQVEGEAVTPQGAGASTRSRTGLTW